jgi:CMP-N,N'-diacetyllegionaminic acid synthase
MKNIAIIPARSGSKGLKDKNIKLLNGKPLIAYTIEAAIESNIFDEIYVSTDSEQYANIAKAYGASVPFLRSKTLSSDSASTWDAVREALFEFTEIGKTFDTCALLQPTSPLRDKNDIINAFNLFIEKKAITVVSVCEVNHPIQWCFPLDSDCLMSEFAKSQYRNMRRQDIPIAYQENGAIYIVSTAKIMNSVHDIYREKCYAYKMDKTKSIDIDEQLDFDIAEYIIRKK